MKKLIKSEVDRFIEFFQNVNVMGVVLGLVIGSAFSQMINSFVNHIIYPSFDFFGKTSLVDRFFVVRPGPNYPYKRLEDAEKDDASVIAYGYFTRSIVNLIIQTLCLFYFVTFVYKLRHVHEKIIK